MGVRELKWLKEASSAITGRNQKPARFVLFSKKGFEIPNTEEILLFDAKQLVT